MDVPTLEPFTCPRCRRPATERFYGPCGSCRDQLRASVGGGAHGEGAAAAPVAFEPQANVTPNHVATRD